MGPGQLWGIVAQKVEEAGGRIHYNHTVHGITLENGRVKSITATAEGGNNTAPCDILFSTMAIQDLIAAVNSGGGDTAPKHITRATGELPYRDFITVGILLKKLKLQNKTKIKTLQNIVPDCWIYIQDRDVRIGRLQIFNNWSPYMVKDPEHTVWLGLEYFCNEGDSLWNLSCNDFINFAIDELVKINIIDEEDILDTTQVKIQKAYPSYFGSYSEMDSIRTYLDTIGNLWCLGRNGQHKYNNMDHSMLTAIKAVEQIKSGSGDKSPVWNVNTEEEYHEEN
jgi:protoporphyrinogen oxidase